MMERPEITCAFLRCPCAAGRAIACAVVAALLTVNVAAAWTYVQDFEGLRLGPLHGQDGWTGANASGETNYTVQSNVVFAGTKAVQVPISTHSTIDRALPSPIAAGDLTVAMRKTHVPGSDIYTVLRDTSESNRMYVRLGTDGRIAAFDQATASYVPLREYAVDTWYVVNIQFDDSANPDRYRVRVRDDGAWSAWSGWLTANGGRYSGIAAVRFDTDAAGDTRGHVGYFDALGPGGLDELGRRAGDGTRGPEAVRSGGARSFFQVPPPR